MPGAIDYYLSPMSPWTYLGHARLVEIARRHGGFTIFALVDALTRLNHKVQFAGNRAAMDQKVGALLSLAA